MNIKNCVYCNNQITTESREHVIQNALGGLYESKDICCPECNNIVSRKIDAPFTAIFNPILGNIKDMVKTRHGVSSPAYTGTVKYEGKLYKANFKAGNITGCPELSKILRCDASKLPLTVEGFDFNLENAHFKNGISKIAFNYALAQGINIDVLRHGFNVQKTNDKIESISFNYSIIPFAPMNAIDEFIELGAPMELYHNMILFSHDTYLWCYLDLFNTFQYYVLLSDKMPAGKPIYDNYMQTLKKINRDIPTVEIVRPSDALDYAIQYDVAPSMDPAEMTLRITEAVQKKINKVPMESIIGKKLDSAVLGLMAKASGNSGLLWSLGAAIQLYQDENEKMRPNTFRALTPFMGDVAYYPYAINEACKRHGNGFLKQYTMSKFARLNQFLIGNNK